ncbi:protein of unknown function DUF81 [Pseudopedobacter saltans DSM 12145]|uniref:Probable membrane transporter protein n=1 Tax=Pseudopedobacter saltans (strain ATCC 51119 / DSM 12145 / JCM 21818 / CCUG 39354 / LMG 10337 / NBRC 100064 / NCIMB 13643) TaxID=762903 RepID=F0S5K8_PSESL|nr:sulfite exporter TauE/SafE family protein [Pseudopedobacter saltans]ADY54182.1 protein of unknown function DUF81 [Pseudopedobacter saltans DSM 12145]
MENELLTYGLALLVGLFLGLTGGGGSILTVPILVYIAKIEPVSATGYSLFIVGVTSLIGMLSYFKEKLVDIKLAVLFAVPSMISVWLVRHFVIHNLPDTILSIGGWSLSKDTAIMFFFAVVMILSSIKMMFFKEQTQGHIQYIDPNFKAAVIGGIIVGVLSGLIGAGGGFLIVPAITLFMGVPVHLAVGTSLLIIALNSLVGFTGDFSHLSEINWSYLLEFSLFSSVGVLVGVYLGKKLNPKRLKSVFAWFVMAVAVVIMFDFFN